MGDFPTTADLRGSSPGLAGGSRKCTSGRLPEKRGRRAGVNVVVRRPSARHRAHLHLSRLSLRLSYPLASSLSLCMLALQSVAHFFSTQPWGACLGVAATKVLHTPH